jgi:hypothetical protein
MKRGEISSNDLKLASRYEAEIKQVSRRGINQQRWAAADKLKVYRYLELNKDAKRDTVGLKKVWSLIITIWKAYIRCIVWGGKYRRKWLSRSERRREGREAYDEEHRDKNSWVPGLQSRKIIMVYTRRMVQRNIW